VDKLDDTWHDRDFLVLREAARNVDVTPLAHMSGPTARDLADRTGLSVEDTYLAMRALADAGLVQARWPIDEEASEINRLSAEARRMVGLWPTAETAADRMIAALEAIAENTDDEDTRSRARKIRDAMTGAGRDIVVAAAAAAITGQIPT
jgi:hypothetical protein